MCDTQQTQQQGCDNIIFYFRIFVNKIMPFDFAVLGASCGKDRLLWDCCARFPEEDIKLKMSGIIQAEEPSKYRFQKRSAKGDRAVE